MRNGFDHILVVCDGSPASQQALIDAAAIADEHEAEISVVALVPDRRANIGCARRGLASTYWNGIMEEMAESDLAAARRILGDRDPEPHFEVVSGAGPSGVRRAVARLGCDLVLVPARGPLRGRLARQVRRRVTAEVVGVRAA
jgi:nucleotide-binding universal stress UspA family protein